jgi:hypothetical protein
MRRQCTRRRHTREVALEAHVVSVAEGAWCPDCQQATAITVSIVVTDLHDPLRVIGRSVTDQCIECLWLSEERV